MMDITHYNNWLKKFQEATRGKTALKDLDKHFPPERDSERTRLYAPLRDHVLSSCYGAAMYDPKKDPHKRERLAITKAREQVDSQRMAMTKLRRFITKHRSLSTMALAGTIIDLKTKKIKIISADKDTVHDVVDILDLMLQSFSTRLVQSIPFVRGKHMLSHFVYGCFIYDRPLGAGRGNNPPTAKTMLLFDLVQLFRLRSQGITARQRGQHMPDNGNPHYSLAAAFVSATFQNEPAMEPEDARNLLRALNRKRKSKEKEINRAGYYPWPALCNEPNR